MESGLRRVNRVYRHAEPDPVVIRPLFSGDFYFIVDGQSVNPPSGRVVLLPGAEYALLGWTTGYVMWRAEFYPVEPLPAVPEIRAMFETTGPMWVGNTEARVRRVEAEDDGSYTVYLDHWPDPANPESVSP